jgi:hypothetical protein
MQRLRAIRLPSEVIVHTINVHLLKGRHTAQLSWQLANLVSSDGELS